MKFYKYVSFKNSYWDDPLKNRSLYFASISRLRTVNDPDEFQYTWLTGDAALRELGKKIGSSYEKHFSRARILCMAMKLNKKCCESFLAKEGGVCYEFSILEENLKEIRKIITAREVSYCDTKIQNAPDFIIGNNKFSKKFNQILLKPNINMKERKILDKELEKSESKDKMRNVIVEHIEEIVFKKKLQYGYEEEYRFVHHMDDSSLKIECFDSDDGIKIKYSDLGMKLTKIYTSNMDKVNKIHESIDIPVHSFGEGIPRSIWNIPQQGGMQHPTP